MLQHIPLSLYYDAYYNFRKHCRDSKQLERFEANYALNLYNVRCNILNKTVDLGTSHVFIVKKPKPREVFAGSIIKRILDWLCIDILKPYFYKHFSIRQFNVRKGYGLKQYHDLLWIDMAQNPDKWIFGGDIKNFFMSMDKDVIWKLWKVVIQKWYGGKYTDDLIYILHEIIYYIPEKHCVRCSPIKDWELIPDEKSLFKNGDNKGLPIGDLVSLYTALLILCYFSKRLGYKCKTIGIYMDDFYLLDFKEVLLLLIPLCRYLLLLNKLKLNENKSYLQPCYKGIKTCGAVIYPNRMYVSNRIVQYTRLACKKDKPIKQYCNSMNSYFGILKQFFTLNIRLKLISMIPKNKMEHLQIDNCRVFKIKKQYDF